MWTIAKRTIDKQLQENKGQFDSKPVKHILRILANHSERNVIQGNKYNTMTAVLFTGVMCRISFFFRKRSVRRFFSQSHCRGIFYNGFSPLYVLGFVFFTLFKIWQPFSLFWFCSLWMDKYCGFFHSIWERIEINSTISFNSKHVSHKKMQVKHGWIKSLKKYSQLECYHLLFDPWGFISWVFD